MEIIMAFIIGLASGILSNHVVAFFRKVRIRLADKRSKVKILQYNPENDDLIVINRWSLERPLLRNSHKVYVDTNRPIPSTIPINEWKEELGNQKHLNRSGNICFLKDYIIDHHENEYGKTFTMIISPCDYSEYMATYTYLINNPAMRNKLIDIANEDPKLYLENALPSNITVNVVVISESSFLAIKRSKSVDTAKNKWTAGPCETMTLSDLSPGSVEDLFSLSERCLKEEIYLTADDYNKIFISWFGMLTTAFRTHIVAVVKISITEGEVIERAMCSHSIYEAEAFEWLPLKKRVIQDFINTNTGILADPKYDWISFAKLSLVEALRVRDIL